MERRREATRADIHETALSLAEVNGADGVTTEELARAAGVSRRTFFNYYRNKEEAILGIALLLPDDMVVILEDPEPDYPELVRSFLAAVFSRLESDRARLRRVMTVIANSSQLSEARLKHVHQNDEMIRNALRKRHPELDDVAMSVLAATTNAALYAMRDLWLIGDVRSVDEGVATVVRALTVTARLISGEGRTQPSS